MRIKSFRESMGLSLLMAVFLAMLILPLFSMPAHAVQPSNGGTTNTTANDYLTWSDTTHIVEFDKTNPDVPVSTVYTETKIQGLNMSLVADNTGTFNGAQGPCPVSMEIDNYQSDSTSTAKLTTYKPQGLHSGPCQVTGTLTLPITNRFKDVPANQNNTTNTTSSPDCPIDTTDGSRFFLCPIFLLGGGLVNFLNSQIQNLLFFPVDQVFASNSPFQSVFNNFRNIGMALLVIAGLFMVISEAAGLEIFAAYTVRKTLPRLIIAAIGMALAWPILRIVITFFNDLGNWANQLISAATTVHGSGSSFDLITWILSIGTAAAGTIGFVLIHGEASWGVILSLIATIGLVLLIGLLVLAIRQLVLLLCILLACLAIAAWVLPGTQRLWNFWRDAIIAMLVVFPIIMGFLAAGKAMASVSGALGAQGILQADILAAIVYFAPYGLLPFAFRLAGGLMDTIFSLANDRGRGLFDRLSKYRQGERAWMHQQRMEGRMGFLGRRGGGLYRRVFSRGGLDFSGGGRQRYRAFDQKRMAALAGKSLEEDAGFASGDDDANRIAMRVRTREGFIGEYMRTANRGAGATREEAEAAFGNIEGSYGARIGSQAMRVAAFQARAASVTGYAGNDEGLKELYQDASSMVAGGFLTSTQAAGIIKANKARGDQSGTGFGPSRSQITRMANSIRAGGGNAISDAEVTVLRQSALEGLQPGALIGGRSEAVEALAPTIRDNLTQAYHNHEIALQSGSQSRIDATQQAVDQNLAQIAGIYDVMSQVAPQNARIFDSQVMSVPLNVPGGSQGVTGQSVRQLIDDARNRQPDIHGRQSFIALRREYASSAAAGYDAERRRNVGLTGPTGPLMGPPTLP